MTDEKSKVTEMPAHPPVQMMAVPPERLAFAAVFDETVPGKLNFLIGDPIVATSVTPAMIYQVLGALRTSIRKWAEQKGNQALADGL